MSGTQPVLDAFLDVLGRIGPGTGLHADLAAILGEWTLELADLDELAAPPPMGCARTLIHRCAAFELVVATWSPGAQTPVHDHGGAACLSTVLSGELLLDDYVIARRGGPGEAAVAFMGSRVLRRGSVDVRATDLDLHRFRAQNGAVSLHLHTAPVEAINVYDPGVSSVRRVSLRFARISDAAARPHEALNRS